MDNLGVEIISSVYKVENTQSVSINYKKIACFAIIRPYTITKDICINTIFVQNLLAVL